MGAYVLIRQWQLLQPLYKQRGLNNGLWDTWRDISWCLSSTPHLFTEAVISGQLICWLISSVHTPRLTFGQEAGWGQYISSFGESTSDFIKPSPGPSRSSCIQNQISAEERDQHIPGMYTIGGESRWLLSLSLEALSWRHSHILSSPPA